MGTKSSSNKNKMETQDTTSSNCYTKAAMAHRAGGQKETSDLGHSEVQDSCPFWLHLLGSAAGTGRGECWGAREDPLSHFEVQVTDWMYFGLVEMSQAPFIQKRGIQGDSRSPDSCPLPQAQGKEASQEAAPLHEQFSWPPGASTLEFTWRKAPQRPWPPESWVWGPIAGEVPGRGRWAGASPWTPWWEPSLKEKGDDVKSRRMEAGPFDVMEKQIRTTSAASSKVPARCKPVAL